MSKLRRSRKASRGSSWQIKWHDGRTDHLVQVSNEKRKNSTITTLLALPWVDAGSIQVRRL